MSKFDTIFANLYEDVAGASAPTNTSAMANTTGTAPVTQSTPPTNTPAGFDQQHIQALAGITNPAGIQDYLKKNNLQLTPVQNSNQAQVTPTPNAA